VVTLSSFLCSNTNIMASSELSNDNEDSDWTDDEVIPAINPSNKIKIVLSKIILSNFRPKQANKWIGDLRVSLF
jgi:hypothetical protein